jgi:protein-tyrosine phosphatase
MGIERLRPRSDTPSAEVARAADTLRRGGLVVMPTETVYGIAACASGPGLDRLRALLPPAQGRWHTWHAASASDIARVAPPRSPLHRRLLDRLTPGPVRLLIELEPAELALALAGLGVGAGVIDNGVCLAVRAPDHPLAAAVLASVGAPVIVERLDAAGWGDGRRCDRVPDDAPVDLVLDAGPTRLGKPSTTLRLLTDGGYQPAGEGAITARAVERRLARTVLFVCTGNTCRSPMAQAIAAHLWSRRGDTSAPGAVPTRFTSAGVGALDGEPTSPEALAALAALGVPGRSAPSRSLAPALIAEADAVFTMTAEHARAVVERFPDAAAKVRPLDPAGPVPDPIGRPVEVYRRTAERLAALIEPLLAELDRPGKPRAGGGSP